MEYIPQIIIEKNLEEENRLFSSFLHHPYYQRKQDDILRMFPALKEKIDNATDEKQAIAEFVAGFYTEHEQQINSIIENAKKLFEQKSKMALAALAKLMDYAWSEEITYRAIPTILPFSPFNGNTFFFSILGDLLGKTQKDKNVLSIAIHEISHFVFFDQIKQLVKSKEIQNPPKETLDFIKEATTAFLLNENPLRTILNIQGYAGNPELKELYVEKNGTKLLLTEYLRDYYHAAQNNANESFLTYTKDIFILFAPRNAEFAEKRALWNKRGSSHATESDKTEYAKPIQL